MWESLLFWLGLLLPGYAALRLAAPEELKSGLLGVVGLSYLAALAVLSPVSILCYVLRLPVAFFAGTCVVAFLVGLALIILRSWWRDLGKLVLAGVSLELFILLADLVTGGRVGAFLGGDAKVHVARIRFLVEHGFSNYDPYVSAKCFFALYHTNILHALYAAGAVLTGAEVLEVWYASLVWAKLVIAAGAYYLTWRVFERSWVAWVGALFLVGWLAPVTFVVYPNQLAPCWLLPLMLGFGVQACQSPCPGSSVLKLAVGSLVLGQVHGLYAIFAGAVLAPLLAAVLLHRLVRGHPDRLRVAACLAALGTGAPFVLMTKYASPPEPPSAPAPASAPAPVTQDDGFHHWANGWVMLKPTAALGGRRGLGLVLLAGGMVGALVGSRRKPAGVLAAMTAIAAGILFIPPVCRAAIQALGEGWIVARAEVILQLGMIAFVPGTVAFWLDGRLRWRGIRPLLSIGAVCLGALFGRHEERHSWPTYYRTATAAQVDRQARLRQLQQMGVFFREHMPRGATVLTDEEHAMWLVMLYDCRVVAAARGSSPPDIEQRKSDLAAMLTAETPWAVRRELLHRYGITAFLKETAHGEYRVGVLRPDY